MSGRYKPETLQKHLEDEITKACKTAVPSNLKFNIMLTYVTPTHFIFTLIMYIRNIVMFLKL